MFHLRLENDHLDLTIGRNSWDLPSFVVPILETCAPVIQHSHGKCHIIRASLFLNMVMSISHCHIVYDDEGKSPYVHIYIYHHEVPA